ncbi:unnamed protein product [Symbiodinium sp. CCMP2592]|nr:unnamed protein product [Symbiodinium sp. CCMP2592]
MAPNSLPLTLTTGPASKADINLDPRSGRPCLCVSVDLQMKLDISDLIQLLLHFAADSRAPAPDKSSDLCSNKTGSVADRSEEQSAPRRKNWTWEEPMYSLEPWIEKYSQRSDVCWRKEESVSAGEPFCVVDNEEYRQAFREMTFEPLPVPERSPMTHANFKEAEVIRFKEAQSVRRSPGRIPVASSASTSPSEESNLSFLSAGMHAKAKAPAGRLRHQAHRSVPSSDEDPGRMYPNQDCKSQ